jgi:peptidyl-dipeptidase Dcp (EC 3.4.15.5). Metallo peptidase. MEROPS family M03A
LISYDDVSTMFHEFGHTLHGLFADQKYISISGTNTPRDFVEFPSQINEFFALEPEILKNYAIHYQTKQPMPQALVDKIKKGGNFQPRLFHHGTCFRSNFGYELAFGNR